MNRYECPTCNIKCRDATDYARHLESNKHLQNVGEVEDNETEVQDIRKMDEDEARKYIHAHKYFDDANLGIADHKRKLKQFGRWLKEREAFATKTPAQIQIDKQKIRDDYPDDENEDQSLQDERFERLKMAEYAGSSQELNDLTFKIDMFMSRQESNRKFWQTPALLAAEAIARDRMITELKRKDKAGANAKSQAQGEAARAELKKKIYEAELAKLELRFGN
jgi:hypothetical protein